MEFAWRKELLIDIGCGRGGDIYKWLDAGVKHVIGLDLSEGEIKEARKRYNEVKEKTTYMEFIQTDLLDTECFSVERKADVVTCMFAIHYFFHSERGVKQLLSNISSFLKPGGYFICCFPDAKRILSLLKGSEKITLPHPP